MPGKFFFKKSTFGGYLSVCDMVKDKRMQYNASKTYSIITGFMNTQCTKGCDGDSI